MATLSSQIQTNGINALCSGTKTTPLQLVFPSKKGRTNKTKTEAIFSNMVDFLSGLHRTFEEVSINYDAQTYVVQRKGRQFYGAAFEEGHGVGKSIGRIFTNLQSTEEVPPRKKKAVTKGKPRVAKGKGRSPKKKTSRK